MLIKMKKTLGILFVVCFLISVTTAVAGAGPFMVKEKKTVILILKDEKVTKFSNHHHHHHCHHHEANHTTIANNTGGTFVYIPPSGTVLGAGTHALSTTFTPTDTANYTTASATAVINVTQQTPAITWSNPANITYGTALSIAQLDATAPVNGTFIYTPSSGTILGAGMQTLSTTFTPTDTANYTTASATAVINVTQMTPTITWSNPANITYGTSLSSAQLDATLQ